MNVYQFIAMLSTGAACYFLFKYIKLQRDLYLLKQQMKNHTLEHGIDNQLWIIFVERTRKLLKLWK